MINRKNQQIAIQNSNVLMPTLEVANFSAIQPNANEMTSNIVPKTAIGNNSQYLRYINSSKEFNKFQDFSHYDWRQKENINGPKKTTYTITPNEQLSPPQQRQSPVDESFIGDIFDLEEPKNQSLKDELDEKTKHIQALEKEIQLMSQFYSDENLRQLEQMNRLIAVILEEKNESNARLESKIREQHDTIHSLSKKLDTKDSMIKTLQGENIFLHKHLNMKKMKSPIIKEFSCCGSDESVDSNDGKCIQINTTTRTLINDDNKEEQYHHPNARRTSPVEPWRKVYVQNAIVKNGRTWYWCPHHRMPDYNGLYVTHHPNDHYKWAEKVAENKKSKSMKKNFVKNQNMLHTNI